MSTVVLWASFAIAEVGGLFIFLTLFPKVDFSISFGLTVIWAMAWGALGSNAAMTVGISRAVNLIKKGTK